MFTVKSIDETIKILKDNFNDLTAFALDICGPSRHLFLTT